MLLATSVPKQIAVYLLLLGGSLLGLGAAEQEKAGSAPAQQGPSLLPFPSAQELQKATDFRPEVGQRSAASREVFLERVQAFDKKLPPTRYDMEALAKSLDGGVEPVFRFVRDQVRYEAYPGVLRGARQTFVGRAGNSFDRSLLLAELLRRKGIATRFVRGTLSDELAGWLHDRMFESSAPADVEPFAAKAEAGSLLARVRNRALRDFATIRNALGDAGPTGAASSRQQVLTEIQDHVWLQAKVDERWVELDSSFADAKPGKAYGADGKVFEKLPKGAYQWVTLRVLAELLDGTTLKEEKLLEYRWPAAAFMNREVFLLHLPGAEGDGLAAALGGGGQKDLWRPALLIEDGLFSGKPVSFAEAGASGLGKPPKGGLGSVFGPGGALGSGKQLVAEWLEFEITFPGKRREVSRRVLLDRAGAEWRQADKKDAKALQPMPRDAKGPVTPRAIHNIWFSSGPHNLAAFAQAAQVWGELMLPNPKTKPAKTEKLPALSPRKLLWPFALQNFAYLVRADNQIAPSLNDGPAHRFYADSPRIFLFTIAPDTGTKKDPVFIIDLHRDRLRGVAYKEGAAAELVARRMWYGVLEGALEHETAAIGKNSALSTSGLVGASGVVVLRGEGARQSADWPRDPRLAAAAARALKAGNTLVVPRTVLAKGPLAWWEVAPDGTTRPVLETWNGGKGVIPKFPTGFPRDPGAWNAHLPKPDNPGGSPTEGEVDFPPEEGGKEAPKKEGGFNEWLMTIINISLPATIALLHEYVDFFLVRTSEAAAEIAETLMEIFRF